MNDIPSNQPAAGPEQSDLQMRREFLHSVGKWSGAAIIAAVGGMWLSSSPEARAAGWVNRRGVAGGGWINGGGGGGWVNGAGWVNRAGGWINGGGGGGGGWVNRRGVGGGAWVNRR
ncbi:MAG TPA: hypothetical protein VIT91_10830 [Chthoniobacterales bacterium]